MLVDTGATETIIRPVVTTKEKIISSKWVLRTAAAEIVKVYDEVGVKIQFGSTCVSHISLVANFEEDIILGLDIKSTCGF